MFAMVAFTGCGNDEANEPVIKNPVAESTPEPETEPIANSTSELKLSDLVGMNYQDALYILENMQMDFSFTVHYEYSDDVAEGIVIRVPDSELPMLELPMNETLLSDLPRGLSSHLWVSKGRDIVQTPEPEDEDKSEVEDEININLPDNLTIDDYAELLIGRWTRDSVDPNENWYFFREDGTFRTVNMLEGHWELFEDNGNIYLNIIVDQGRHLIYSEDPILIEFSDKNTLIAEDETHTRKS